MNNPLLAEIQRFAVGKNAYHRDEPPESKKKLKIKSGVSNYCFLDFFSCSNSVFGEAKFEAS